MSMATVDLYTYYDTEGPVAVTASRHHRAGARRNARPQPCQRCRTLIVWGRVLEPDGTLRVQPTDPRRLVYVPLNAEPVPTGRFEYVRGDEGSPVVRELDEPERLVAPENHRFQRHYDLPSEDL